MTTCRDIIKGNLRAAKSPDRWIGRARIRIRRDRTPVSVMNRLTGGKDEAGKNDNQNKSVLHASVFVLQNDTGCVQRGADRLPTPTGIPVAPGYALAERP